MNALYFRIKYHIKKCFKKTKIYLPFKIPRLLLFSYFLLFISLYFHFPSFSSFLFFILYLGQYQIQPKKRKEQNACCAVDHHGINPAHGSGSAAAAALENAVSQISVAVSPLILGRLIVVKL